MFIVSLGFNYRNEFIFGNQRNVELPAFFQVLPGLCFLPPVRKMSFDMLPAFLPPSRIMISLYSSRLWRAKVPEMTIVFPSRFGTGWSGFLFIHFHRTPAAVSRRMLAASTGPRRKSYILRAITVSDLGDGTQLLKFIVACFRSSTALARRR